jgi:uncharacterized protein (DUF488 family)
VESLYTIGYEGRGLDGFLRALAAAGVTLLCDVRRNPASRKPGFAKSALAAACAEVGIRYEHLPELGIAAADRHRARTPAKHEALLCAYERDALPKQTEALASIQGWIAAGECVALTCFEREPECCHRHCVAQALQDRCRDGLAVTHL